MKRFIFSVCALAAVVVGCTKSEVINRPHAEEPIQFNPYLGRIPVTKGSIADETVLGTSGFQVYAYMHAPVTTNTDGSFDYGEGSSINHATATPYMNKVVKKVGDAWTYTGHAYWPATNQLDFIAYGLNSGDKVTEESATDHTKINFTVDTDIKTHQDLLVAKACLNRSYNDTQEEDAATVNFTFSHLLSRIGFSLITKADNSIPVTLKQVNLEGNFFSAGKVNLLDVAALKITPTGDAASITYKLLGDNGTFTDASNAEGVPVFDNSMLYEFIGSDTADNYDDDEYKAKDFKVNGEVDTNAKETATAQANANKDNRYMMIIPTATHNAKLKVIYCLPGAKTFDEVVIDLSEIEFKAGKAYDFKFKVSTNGISFGVTIESWDDTTTEDDTIHKLN